ncbi:MAG: hypothetical protein NTX82_06135 [Candidatus Parcubacteria bacterium]|nr:hypothetical protein [Candidatus Parcubacteria bacterium]
MNCKVFEGTAGEVEGQLDHFLRENGPNLKIINTSQSSAVYPEPKGKGHLIALTIIYKC